ncbi:MAG: WYL domain-containing protein [Clostridiales bacterium]|nr:WYL domain-containing protein [Clostridiales bacterium]
MKSPHQKLRLLTLMSLLLEETDEDHPLTVPDLLERLERRGLSAERKAVYDDIEALRDFGLDILCNRRKPAGYFVGGRQFELPELKLLVDAVQSSKFITSRKSSQLIRKLETLTSAHQAERLHRQVFVHDRVKTMNESIYYNVDRLYDAIAADRQITFKYMDFSADGQLRFRREGERYAASPYALAWADENYYLVAYYETYGRITHFRVDKMADIRLSEARRSGKEIFRGFNLAEHVKYTFGMFSGEQREVLLRFENRLAGVVIDRFGRDIDLRRADDDHFDVRLPVTVSPAFFAWVFQFGGGVRILSPSEVAEQLKERARLLSEQYAD